MGTSWWNGSQTGGGLSLPIADLLLSWWSKRAFGIYIYIYLQFLYIYIPVIHDMHLALIWTPFYFFSGAICLKSSAIDILGASSIGTGVGLSSIRSTNTLEIAFFVIVAFRSLMTYATLVSSITSLTSQLSKIKARWREMGWWTGIGDFFGTLREVLRVLVFDQPLKFHFMVISFCFICGRKLRCDRSQQLRLAQKWTFRAILWIKHSSWSILLICSIALYCSDDFPTLKPNHVTFPIVRYRLFR